MTSAAEAVVITPRQVPELRSNLVRTFPGWALRSNWGGAANTERTRLDNQVISGLSGAALYHLDLDFVALLDHAAATLPDHVLTECDPPTNSGVVLRSRVSRSELEYPPGSGKRTPVATGGYAWLVTGPTLWACALMYIPLLPEFHGNHQTDGLQLLPLLDPVELGTTVEESIQASVERKGFGASLALRELYAFWNLIRQESVTETAAESVPRPERRRLDRSGGVPASSIRIIRLRRRSSGVGSAHEASGREFHHRWIVRGHWRKQWYPSLKDHRPVWIAPHIKGPEDKPLLGGEKVYVADAVTAGGSPS
jgi:hypothetical protein